MKIITCVWLHFVRCTVAMATTFLFFFFFYDTLPEAEVVLTWPNQEARSRMQSFQKRLFKFGVPTRSKHDCLVNIFKQLCKSYFSFYCYYIYFWYSCTVNFNGRVKNWTTVTDYLHESKPTQILNIYINTYYNFPQNMTNLGMSVFSRKLRLYFCDILIFFKKKNPELTLIKTWVFFFKKLNNLLILWLFSFETKNILL